MGELEEYVEDLDSDLSDMEEVLFGDDEDECDCDEEDGCSCDEEEELSFDCPHCGKNRFGSRLPTSTMMKAPCANSAASPSSWMRRMTGKDE